MISMVRDILINNYVRRLVTQRPVVLRAPTNSTCKTNYLTLIFGNKTWSKHPETGVRDKPRNFGRGGGRTLLMRTPKARKKNSRRRCAKKKSDCQISVLLASGVKKSLAYWFIAGLTPQQQPGSYQGGEMMMMKSVFWWRKPEYEEETGGNHRPTASNWRKFSHIRPLPSPGIELGPQRCEAKWAKAWWEQ